MHHLKAIDEFKLELQSGNAQFGSKSANFLSCVTLKFDGWPWKSIRHLFYTTSSPVHHFKAISEFKLELQSGNVQFRSKSAIFFTRMTSKFWQMTLTNNRAPLLYYIKLRASFQSHWWIQTVVTVWKRSIRVKIGNFLSRVTLKFDEWPWKTIGHLFYATSSFVHHFITICEFKLELQSGNARFRPKSTIFKPCDLKISQMILRPDRAPLLTCFKLCASFRSHW